MNKSLSLISCRSMWTEKSSFLLLRDLFLQLLLIFISSLHWICLFLCVFVRLLLIASEREDLSVVHLSSLFLSLGHFLCFTLSYAEILPWEIGLLIFLFLLNVRQLNLTWTDPFVTDDHQQLGKKFLFVNVGYFLYALHLCLTTICTPQMYFNWFLIIHNCRYTYSNQFSSYTLSGGVVTSLPWVIYRLKTVMKRTRACLQQ